MTIGSVITLPLLETFDVIDTMKKENMVLKEENMALRKVVISMEKAMLESYKEELVDEEKS